MLMIISFYEWKNSIIVNVLYEITSLFGMDCSDLCLNLSE